MNLKKMGRPKSINPKNIELKVRIDEEINKKLLIYCNQNEVTKTEVIRKGIILILEQTKTEYI